MKVLLITSKEEDYLQDSVIHGFKQLVGNDAIEYPVKCMLYKDYKDLSNIRGKGFTLYGLLDTGLKLNKELNIFQEISLNKFDLIIFTSIHRQYDSFYKHFKLLKKTSAITWIIDGEDSPVLFPYSGRRLKRFFHRPKPHINFLYFKRELLPETVNSIYFKMPVNSILRLQYPKNIKPISFSIPDEKIIQHKPLKTKLFTTHIVDEEVAAHVDNASIQYSFNNERDYFMDIQQSKYGITTRRAGWDCMRHYEIAANGAVMCFKHLTSKPADCAPHGLVPGYNCISYSSYSDLVKQVNEINEQDYNLLQLHSLQWIRSNTTLQGAKKLLEIYNEQKMKTHKYD
jgi:hypothetical protein